MLFDSAEDEKEILDEWREFLDDFEEIYDTIFKPRGYSKDTAVILWTMNRQENVMRRIRDALQGEES
jgi:hypothetical protein